MSMSKEQQRRLMDLLSKLADKDTRSPTLATASFLDSNQALDFGGQEHTDAKTLVHLNWIRPRYDFINVANSWSVEGIYDFELTEDGSAALAEWNSSADGDGNGPQQQANHRVMVIHGSQEGRVPQVVDDIRLWCYDQGLSAYKASDLANSGRFVNDKVGDAMEQADYYIVILTPDSELKTGEFHARQNAVIEMGRVLRENSSKVCVLKDPTVEMPSDYRGLITEPLGNWKSVLQKELRGAGLL